MKKAFIVFICLLCLAGCQNKDSDNIDYDCYKRYSSPSGYTEKGKEKGNPETYEFYIDQNLALALGDAAIKDYWGEDVLKHTTYEVCEVAGKDYYVITRKPKLLFGASYQVCISKTDGAILRAEKL